MKSRLPIFLVAIAVVVVAGFLCLRLSSKWNYEQLRELNAEAPTFAVRPFDAEVAAFLKKVQENGELLSSESPDPAYARIAEVTPWDASVEGVVALFTYEIPPFSFFDERRNGREGAKAAIRIAALPISVDGFLFVGDGVAYVRVSEEIVEVYEDTEEGLCRSHYLIKLPLP